MIKSFVSVNNVTLSLMLPVQKLQFNPEKKINIKTKTRLS